MDLEGRGIQTRVKHQILEEYLARWGYIIVNGLAGPYENLSRLGKSFEATLVYVDCFSSVGRYKSESSSEQPVFGSPVIGITALKKIRERAKTAPGFIPKIFSILIEKEKHKFEALLDSIKMAGFGSSINLTTDFTSLKDGQIAVINGEWQNYVDGLLTFTGRPYTKAFYFLDPYGPKGIPLAAVEKVITQKSADVMINFPYQDLHKKSGSVVKETVVHQKHIEQYDQLYGDDRWRLIAKEYYAVEETDKEMEDLERRLTDTYKKTLEEKDPEIAIKLTRLKFKDRERTMFYLFLTTHDPTGALAINEILDHAELRQYDLREQQRNIKGNLTQISMFDTIEDPSRPTNERPDNKTIAEEIYQLCRGETIKFREVLRRFVDEIYYHGEIKKAMTILKNDKRASYEKLTNETLVTFK